MKKIASGNINVHYKWTIGEYGEKFFSELKENKKILGVKCPRCRGVIVPPYPVCGKCFVKAEEWIELTDEGRAYGIVPYLLEFPGQYKKPPIVFARILLDNTNTTFFHILDEIDINDLVEGIRVKAVWREEREGNMDDIKYFKPIR